MKIFVRHLFLACLLLLALQSLGVQSTRGAPALKTVLVLSPFQPDLSTNLIASQALREEFGKAADLSLDVYYEYLDLSRFSAPEYQNKVFAFLKDKYKDKQIDLVIVGSEAMLKLWLAQRAEILPAVPIVFYDVFSEHLNAFTLPEDVTGISGLEDCETSLRWALTALPALNEVVLVGGVGKIEQGFFDHIQKLEDDLKDRVKFTNLAGLSLAEIQKRVSQLPNTAIVLYHPMFEDAQGNKYHPLDAARQLSAASSVPVVSGYDVFVGTGVVGGYIYSVDQQARDAAQTGLRLLRGEAVRSIALQKDTSNRYIFDHLALQRFNIPLSALPPQSIIKNRQYSFWELYQPQIIATGIGMAVLLLLVVFLLGLTRQLARARGELSHLNANLENQVQERTTTLNQTNSQLQEEITERRRVEAALRESEELKNAIFNSLNAHIAVLDQTGLIIAVNEPWRNFARANGVDQLVGTVEQVNYLDLLRQAESTDPQEITPIRLGLEAVLLGAQPSCYLEYPCDSPTEKRWFSMMVVPLNSGQGGLVITHENITHRKQDEQALRESELILQGVLQSTGDGILAVDSKNRISFVNERFAKMWNIPAVLLSSKDDSLLLRHVLDQLNDPQKFHEQVQALYQSEQESFDVLNFKDGRVFERLTLPLILDGKIDGRVWSFRDVTQRLQVEEQLRESEEKFRSLLDSQEVAIMIYDFDGVYHYINRVSAEMINHSGATESIIGKRLHDLYPQATADWQLDQIRQVFASGQGFARDTYNDLDNQSSWWHLNLQPIRDRAGQVKQVMVSALDITDRKRAEVQSHETLEALQTIIYSSPLAILALDADDHVLMWNPAAEAMFGWTDKQVMRELNPTVPENKFKEYQALRQATLNGMAFSNIETVRQKKNGEQFSVSLSVAPLRDQHGQVSGRLHIVSDITDRKKLQEELRQQATTDELTRISNRRHFIELAQYELKRSMRFKSSTAIALIDIDHFKQINDTYGHAAGDLALIWFSKTFKKYIRSVDVFARYGGDEFVLLLPETTQDLAFEIVERVRQALAINPIDLNGQSVTLTISTGVTDLTGELQSLDMLLSQADKALYHAKEIGRNIVVRHNQME